MKGWGNLSFRYSKGPFIKIYRTYIRYNDCIGLIYMRKRYHFPLEGIRKGYHLSMEGIYIFIKFSTSDNAFRVL